MNELSRFRMVLLTVIVALLPIAGVLYFAPLVLWLSIPAKIMAIVLASLALGAGDLFLFTLFPASDDLWETGYFKYMRAFYGDTWGGRGRPYQIDVCKAIELSAIVSVLWMLFFGAMAALWYVDINALGSSLKSSGLPHWGEGGAVSEIIMYNLIVIAYLIFWSMYLIIFPQAKKRYNNDFLNKIAVAGTAHVAAALVFLMAVIPTMYYGRVVFLKVGYGLAVIVIAFLILAAVYATIKISIKGLKALYLTVPGQLLARRDGGIKDKICPLITQKRG